MKNFLSYKPILITVLFLFNTLFYAQTAFPQNSGKYKKGKEINNEIKIIRSTNKSAADPVVYCPLSSKRIVNNLSIIGGESALNAIYVQISSGYVSTEDLLTLAGSFPNLTSRWNEDLGILTISKIEGSTASIAEFTAAVNSIEYRNVSPMPTGVRNFSISLDSANYLPSTQHYYQFVSSPGISWGDAKRAAAASVYYGVKGYLVTITSLDEAMFVGEQLSGTGWIGASDARKEPEWRWETGPEEGTLFWYGRESGSTTTFAYWNNYKEPNNGGELALIGVEDYAYITSPGDGQKGRWNDTTLYGSSDPSSPAYPRGYIVEYGGMPGDVFPDITVSTSLTMLSVTETKASEVCGSGSSTIEAKSSAGTVNWYDAETGGNLLATSFSYTTPILNQNQTYYVAAEFNGCVSKRLPVEVRVNKVPEITSVSNPEPVCGSGIFFLEATISEGTINWFDTKTGGTPLGTGPLYITPSISKNTTYYAEANNNDCKSVTRTPIDIEIYPLPEVQDQEVILCAPNSVTLDAGISNMTYLWSTGETTRQIIVSQLGKYSVEVTANTPGNCSNTKNINVIELPAPEIQKVDVIDRTVTITLVHPETYYEYSVDGFYFQDSNVFNEVAGGLQTATVRDKSNCKKATQTFVVLVFPAFFTPNNDTYNDLWEISGIENYPQVQVTIFDRYGKYIAQLNGSKMSWDGTFNKTLLPADDYWFAAKIDDTKPIIRGHFSLKR